MNGPEKETKISPASVSKSFSNPPRLFSICAVAIVAFVFGTILGRWGNNGYWRYAKTKATIIGREESRSSVLAREHNRRIIQTVSPGVSLEKLPHHPKCDVKYSYEVLGTTFYGQIPSFSCADIEISIWYSKGNPSESYRDPPRSSIIGITSSLFLIFGTFTLLPAVFGLLWYYAKALKRRIEESTWLKESRYMSQLNFYQRLGVLVGVIVVVVLLLFPPHMGNAIIQGGDNIHTQIGHHLIFIPPAPTEVCKLMNDLGIKFRGNELRCDYFTFTSNLDTTRLFTEFLMSFSVIAIAFLVMQRKK